MSLDPVLKRLIASAYLKGFGKIHLLTPNEVRRYLSHPKLNVPKASYRDFQTQEGLTLRCYYPTDLSFKQQCPVVIYLSATAFVIDRLDASNDYCSLLANTLKMKVINISYRLAPEYKFPQFLYDCVNSIKWIFHHATMLHILQEKIALWGESSGASIAATSTHLLRDEGCPFIQHQTLFYPMVDLVTPFPSKQKYGQGYMLDLSFIQWLDTQGFHPTQDRADPLVSPLRALSFEKLPPATIITAKYDPLRDEGEAYAQKLHDAGVPVQLKRFDNMIHGFMRFYNKVTTAKEALTFAGDCLKAHFNH
jgi:acetyl esterase